MRRVMVVILVMLGLLAWPGLGLAADEQPLGEVKFANPDQQAVAAVIVELENAYNNKEKDKVMSLFANDAQLLTGMKGNLKGDWVTKKVYEEDVLNGKIGRRAAMGFGIKYYKPTAFEVNNQIAIVKLPYLNFFPHGDFWEAGFFKFDLVKVDGKWLIKKMYWEVTDTHSSMDYPVSKTDAVVF